MALVYVCINVCSCLLLFGCSLGGLVLDYTVVSYDEVAVFQPVINGTCCVSLVLW